MTNGREQRWAIVGGGLLGLTLALRLSEAGKQVTVFEAANEIGGLASAWTIGDVVWDRHYHVTLLSDASVRNLLNELGLEDDMHWVETRTGFFTDAKLYSMSNTVEFLRFPPLGLIDKLRLGLTIFYASRIKDWQKLENILVEDWLRRWSGRSTFEKIWLPLLRAKLGKKYRKTSAAFIWATIARMYAARRTGLKREMFGYVRGGYAQILKRFSEVLAQRGVSVQLRHAIRSVSSNAGSVDIEFENCATDSFDQVVLTIPSPIAARVCADLTSAEVTQLNSVQYQGIVCASVLLRKPLAGYYVLNITDRDVPFTAVIEMSALVDPGDFGSRYLIYLPKYVDPSDPLFDQSDEQIEESFLSGLSRIYPNVSRDDVAAFRISRVRHVFPIPTLNYSANVPPTETSISGVHIVNSTQILNGTLNVNETVQLAERTAARLISTPRPNIECTKEWQPQEQVTW